MNNLLEKILYSFGYIKEDKISKFTGYPMETTIAPGKNHVEFAKKLEDNNEYPVIVRHLVSLNKLKSHKDTVLFNKREFINYFNSVESFYKDVSKQKGEVFDINCCIHVCYRAPIFSKGSVEL